MLIKVELCFAPKANDATYEIKRPKQVLIHRKDEKRAFTTVLLGFCKGEVLFVQSVQKRVTSISLPIKNVFQEAFTLAINLL